MAGKRRLISWTVTFVVAGLIIAAIVLTRPHTRPLTLRGAVIRQDADPTKELPLADVEIAVLFNGSPIGEGKSENPFATLAWLANLVAERKRDLKAGMVVITGSVIPTFSIAPGDRCVFTVDDREGASGVCIVNQSLAKRLFPGETALGKVLLRGRDAELRAEIVGVIHDVKTTGLNAPAPDEIYYPMRQLGQPGMAVVARTAGDPGALQAAIRAAAAEVDKDQPISFFATLETTIAQSLGAQRIVASLTAIFAGLALVLSAIGLYSVLAYAVSQRTPELGIRMALGAQPGHVVGLVLRGGLRLVAIGLVAGIAGAAAAARLIQTLLFDVQPLDPLIYGGVAVVFTVVATLACLVPSVRASRIDPLAALRAD